MIRPRLIILLLNYLAYCSSNNSGNSCQELIEQALSKTHTPKEAEHLLKEYEQDLIQKALENPSSQNLQFTSNGLKSSQSTSSSSALEMHLLVAATITTFIASLTWYNIPMVQA